MEATRGILLLSTVMILAVFIGMSFAQSETATSDKPLYLAPLFRYWNQRHTQHFYTTDWNEIQQVIPRRKGKHGYTADGIACIILTRPTYGAVPLYRFYHSRKVDHMYTINPEEIVVPVIHGRRGKNGYHFEWTAGYCYPTRIQGTVPLYRYYHAGLFNHLYTTNPAEIGTTSPGHVGKLGYRSEGITCYVYPNDPRVF